MDLSQNMLTNTKDGISWASHMLTIFSWWEINPEACKKMVFQTRGFVF
jgi:hypothetical protein